MKRRQFLALAAGSVAALVAAEVIPSFDALPLFTAIPKATSIGIEGQTAYVCAMNVVSASQVMEPFSLWITDGVQRLCLVAGRVGRDVPYVSDLPIVIPPTHQLVVDGNVRAGFMLAWMEPASTVVPSMQVNWLEV